MHPALADISVPRETPIFEALRILDETAGKILFVVGDEGVLAGVLTDGDIRRHILANRGLSEPVVQAMNVDPVFAAEDASIEDIRETMSSRRVHCIPVLDSERRIVSAMWWEDVFDGPSVPARPANVPVAIMAGGKGTRLEPFTRILPKPLMPVGEPPLLRLIMDKFHDQGCTEFLVSLNFKASLIRAYFADEALEYPISFFDEDRPLGTAGSLALMKDHIKSTFILTNCDTILDIEFADAIEKHRESGNLITIIASMKHLVLPYGICELNDGGSLKELKEKPRYDLLASTGVYILEPEVLEQIPLDQPTHATDLIAKAMDADARVGIYPIAERCWLDVGQLEELQYALDRLGVR